VTCWDSKHNYWNWNSWKWW